MIVANLADEESLVHHCIGFTQLRDNLLRIVLPALYIENRPAQIKPIRRSC